MKVATAAEMRALDQRAIQEIGIPGTVLMEAAGIALSRGVLEECGGTVRDRRIAIVCGKGNNGGDGFVAARHLSNRGAQVTVFLCAARSEIKGYALTQVRPIERTAALEIRLIAPDAPLDLLQSGPYATVVDCLLGTGTRLPLHSWYASLIREVNAAGKRWACPIIACDIPSGIDADTGAADACGAINATRTVTFALPKPGLLVYPGSLSVGRLTVADIGIPADLHDDLKTFLTTQDEVAELLPAREESRDANKGSFGTLLVIAGSAGMAGASALTAISALRAGVGLVMLAVPESVIDIAAALAPEAVLYALPETPKRTHGGPGAVDAALALAEKADGIAMGPGMGTGEEVVRFVQEFVARAPKSLVLDADGLNAVAGSPDVLRHRSQSSTVLTPHPGEMGRLLDQKTAEVQADRFRAAKAAAERYGAVALLKGSRTLIADSDGRMAINRRGSAALATAGSGDVLTGVIGALLAQGLSAFDAARVGAYLHALAGEDAGAALGTAGVIAGDVRDRLPLARRRLYEPMDLDDI